MNAASASRSVRLARLLRPAGHPLSRGVDRLEAAVVLSSVLLALVLVPVMLTFGTQTYVNVAEQSEHQAQNRHETVAVLTEDAPEMSTDTHGETAGGTASVAARWQLPDGTVRTGQVKADVGLDAGTEVSAWLDDSGQPVTAPLSTFDAVGAGVLVAFFGWTAAVGLLGVSCWGLRTVLDRHRYRAWEAEWARVEPDWHDRKL
jgi:hypothetical protein